MRLAILGAGTGAGRSATENFQEGPPTRSQPWRSDDRDSWGERSGAPRSRRVGSARFIGRATGDFRKYGRDRLAGHILTGSGC